MIRDTALQTATLRLHESRNRSNLETLWVCDPSVRYVCVGGFLQSKLFFALSARLGVSPPLVASEKRAFSACIILFFKKPFVF